MHKPLILNNQTPPTMYTVFALHRCWRQWCVKYVREMSVVRETSVSRARDVSQLHEQQRNEGMNYVIIFKFEEMRDLNKFPWTILVAAGAVSILGPAGRQCPPAVTIIVNGLPRCEFFYQKPCAHSLKALHQVQAGKYHPLPIHLH